MWVADLARHPGQVVVEVAWQQAIDRAEVQVVRERRCPVTPGETTVAGAQRGGERDDVVSERRRPPLRIASVHRDRVVERRYGQRRQVRDRPARVVPVFPLRDLGAVALGRDLGVEHLRDPRAGVAGRRRCCDCMLSDSLVTAGVTRPGDHGSRDECRERQQRDRAEPDQDPDGPAWPEPAGATGAGQGCAGGSLGQGKLAARGDSAQAAPKLRNCAEHGRSPTAPNVLPSCGRIVTSMITAR
jgi:hypothetical protein